MGGLRWIEAEFFFYEDPTLEVYEHKAKFELPALPGVGDVIRFQPFKPEHGDDEWIVVRRWWEDSDHRLGTEPHHLTGRVQLRSRKAIESGQSDEVPGVDD